MTSSVILIFSPGCPYSTFENVGGSFSVLNGYRFILTVSHPVRNIYAELRYLIFGGFMVLSFILVFLLKVMEWNVSNRLVALDSGHCNSKWTTGSVDAGKS